MIKKVIKLDGREEDFIPSKLSHWGEWAAQTLENYVDWQSVVDKAQQHLPDVMTSQGLQQELINQCLDINTWSSQLMAGRLYVPLMRKKIFGSDIPPTIKSVHDKLFDETFMVKLDYSEEEYAQLEQVIDHNLDFHFPYASLYHIRYKYSLRNLISGDEFESPQFVYMRMAMALAENEPRETRLHHVQKYYEHFSKNRLSAPTPNYVNLGTSLKGYASCCLFVVDDTGPSLATGDYISNLMTQKSAGIGNNLMIRSVGDKVRGGVIKHHGKLAYLSSMGKSIKSNMQNGRSGSGTTYYSAFDPEAETIAQLSNPRSPDNKRNRDLHYALMNNSWFAYKVAQKQDIFVFNAHTAPDLTQSFFSGDIDNFIDLYQKYEADPKFKKTYVSARQLLLSSFSEAGETGVAYRAQMDEVNRHTPFIEPIYSSNLCAEVMQPTTPYLSAEDLYRTDDHGRGEISTCNLAAAIIYNIPNDVIYADVMYYAYKMIDKTTEMAEYAFPHLRFTALQRRNAGVGMMGLATSMAIAGVKISQLGGKHFVHKVAERHMWFATGASLRIAKERGNAPWIHKTKWPKGWTPMKTYNRNVDSIAPFVNVYDWDKRSQEIIDQGGLAHSVLVCYMPGESSSKAIPGCPNSLYPLRAITISKGDGNLKMRWAAFESDRPGMDYEIAWEIPMKDMIEFYAIFQKWTDMGISADYYRRLQKSEVMDEAEIVPNYLYQVHLGHKTSYYFNTQTSDGAALDAVTRAISMPEEQKEPAVETFTEIGDSSGICVGGSCSL